MKKILCSLIAFVLLCTALLALSSCGSQRYEISSKSSNGATLHAYIDVNPNSLKAGDLKPCRVYYCYEEEEAHQTFPAIIAAYENNHRVYIEIRGVTGDAGVISIYDPISNEWNGPWR